jgi:hypothetical protein
LRLETIKVTKIAKIKHKLFRFLDISIIWRVFLFSLVLNQREFDEPLPNPSWRRRGAEIFLVDNEKIRVSKPLEEWGRGMEMGFLEPSNSR